ncbi:Zn-ribbon domain-containing OB-fold protein [Dactylosporangium sp. CS-033363]|uniref:Zn-ribbon domain-containing OB-fold protein n=1 Tax=Dactylosporangium sp. CS-033363 TaxID=3239935 RepID=UPI003D8F56B8
MTRPPSRPLPDPDYVDFAPFWAGTARGELLVPACAACSRNVWPPRMACPDCAGLAFDWRPLGGRGRLYSHTTIGRAMLAGFEAEVPYTVVIVAAAADPRVRFVGRLAGGFAVPAIGAEMAAVFEPVDGVTLVYWRPVSPLTLS